MWRGQSLEAGTDVTLGVVDVIARRFDISPTELEDPGSLALDRRISAAMKRAIVERMMAQGAQLRAMYEFRIAEGCVTHTGHGDGGGGW